MVPTTYAKSLGGKNYDVAYPREFTEHVKKDEKLDKAVSHPYLIPLYLSFATSTQRINATVAYV